MNCHMRIDALNLIRFTIKAKISIRIYILVKQIRPAFQTNQKFIQFHHCPNVCF